MTDWPWARHWPLIFLGLAVFLFFRSHPETWPMGNIGFLESFRDVEVLQHSPDRQAACSRMSLMTRSRCRSVLHAVTRLQNGA